MTLSKKRKVYVCVLGLAVLILLVDRVFLGPAGLAPEEASAGPVGTSSSAAAVGKSATTGAPQAAEPAPEQSIVVRLRALGQAQTDTAAVRDAFRPSPSWLAEMRPSRGGEASGRSDAPRRSFNHRLMAVMMDGQGGLAIIDGKCLRVGQTMDGFTLVRLSKSSAVLEAGGQKVKLRLDEENPKTGL